AALQTVGAFLVIAMVVTPGATAYLLSDRFPRVLAIAIAIGVLSSFFGAYLSFFVDGATGGIIICLQTLAFILAFLFAPKHGLLASRRRGRTGAAPQTPAPDQRPQEASALPRTTLEPAE
ncbi:MAG: metal ABC transporter permease, partial [Pseudomonadota bacterium]